ncbi:MAG: hypothetical protein ACYDH4_02535 [Candidatus Cryosericum sp.]
MPELSANAPLIFVVAAVPDAVPVGGVPLGGDPVGGVLVVAVELEEGLTVVAVLSLLDVAGDCAEQPAITTSIMITSSTSESLFIIRSPCARLSPGGVFSGDWHLYYAGHIPGRTGDRECE